MKNTELAALVNFYERFIGDRDSEYGFRLEPLTQDSVIQSLNTGDGNSLFTPFDAGDKSGVIIGYRNHEADEDDYRFMLKFESTDSIDALISALKESRKVLRRNEIEAMGE